MDRLHCMQVFVRVVEHKAFGKAADALGISRASVTEAVAQLEKRLGVRLLNRTTRRVSVTDEGQSYYANCVRILGDVAEAEDGLSGARLEPRGRLRVSVPQSFVNATFFPRLTQFFERFPKLEVEIVFTDRAVNLVEEGVDCAIRGVEIAADADLVVRKLATTRWLTCAAPGYLAEHAKPRAPADLAEHNCIRFVSPSTGRPRDWVFEANGKPLEIVPRGNLRVTSYDAVAQIAINGGGMVQIPDALGFGPVMEGKLQPVLTDYVALAPTLVLVYPGNRYLTAKVRAFTDFFVETFPQDGWWTEIVRKAESARQ